MDDTSIEARLIRAILGQAKASALMTDAYINSMAQAGAPLRMEMFYGTFRREGAWLNPFDLHRMLRLLRPDLPDLKERGFLQTWGYGLTPAMERSLSSPMETSAIPKGCWFGGREPLMGLYSTSYWASWPEPLALMFHYPIQIATAAKHGKRNFEVTCEDEATIVRLAFEAVGLKGEAIIRIKTEEYRQRVRAAWEAVVEALGGPDQAHRAFEVGMRSATCMQQHRIVLEECKRVGITRTSNLFLAYELNMIPVGTTGHAHQMRHGADINGFRAIRDSRPEMPSYLFDTRHPIHLGIPALIQVMLEDPSRACSARFDSGNQDEQFTDILGECGKHSLGPVLIFEDSYNDVKTVRNESFLAAWQFPKEERAWYGYGGYGTSRTAFSEYTRDLVSFVWKLCLTSGMPVQKQSGTPGKESNGGRLVSYTRVFDEPADPKYADYQRLIAQQGEPVRGFVALDSPKGMSNSGGKTDGPLKVRTSPETWAISERVHEQQATEVAARMRELGEGALADVVEGKGR